MRWWISNRMGYQTPDSLKNRDIVAIDIGNRHPIWCKPSLRGRVYATVSQSSRSRCFRSTEIRSRSQQRLHGRCLWTSWFWKNPLLRRGPAFEHRSHSDRSPSMPLGLGAQTPFFRSRILSESRTPGAQTTSTAWIRPYVCFLCETFVDSWCGGLLGVYERNRPELSHSKWHSPMSRNPTTKFVVFEVSLLSSMPSSKV